MISFEGFDIEELSAGWTRALPFPHLILDELLPADAFAALQRAAREEALVPQGDEIYQHHGSSEPPSHELLRGFQGTLESPPFLELLKGLTGAAPSRVSMRTYRYDRGDYLLPHTDWRPGEERLLAFAYYLGNIGAEPLRGGELDLYDCTLEGESIVRTRLAKSIEPRPNRLALFSVSARALHRVREVVRGQRLSLAGWFVA